MAMLIWPLNNTEDYTQTRTWKKHYYKNTNAVNKVICDITRARENEQKKASLMAYGAMGCGYNLSAEDIIQEFVFVQKVYDIDRRKGRRMYHELFTLTDKEVEALHYGYNLLVGVAKANILNVACTRAKYRIAFIGNINDWKNRRYFWEFIPKFIDMIDA